MKKIKKCLFFSICILSLLLVVLSISVMVNEIDQIRSIYISVTLDVDFDNFISFVRKKPNYFKSNCKIIVLSITQILMCLSVIIYSIYKISPKAKQKIGDLKEKYTLYQRKKLERKKEKIAEKINKLNNEGDE